MTTIWTSYYMITKLDADTAKLTSSERPGQAFLIHGVDVKHLQRVIDLRNEQALHAFCDYVQHAHRGKVVTAGF